MNIRAHLKLVRISALPSALADVFGGMALVAAVLPGANTARWPWLLLATGGIYLGGMALNDVMHAQKDILLRKKRPIVTGELSYVAAFQLTCVLYAAGLAGAVMAGCAGTALVLAGLTVVYNWLSRGSIELSKLRLSMPRQLASVVVIAACRALNVRMALFAFTPAGMGISQGSSSPAPWVVWSVFLYFALVTIMSLFEDSGEGRRALRVVGILLVPVVFAVPVWALGRPGQAQSLILGAFAPLLIAAALVLNLWRAIGKARAEPTPANLGACVGMGIRGECLLMGAIALAIAPHKPVWAFAALACYPVALWLGRRVSPT